MDIGPLELIFLVLLGIVMFGPERIPTIARKAGRVVRYLGAIANDAKGQLRQELGPEWDGLELSDLNPKNFISKHLLDSNEVAAVRSALDESKGALSQAGQQLNEMSDGVAALDASSAGEAGTTAVVFVGSAFDPEAT